MATTEEDSLDSRGYAHVIDLLCEGQIEGFPSARNYVRDTPEYNKAMLKDVYFDKTPVLQPGANISNLSDSDYNFAKVRSTDLDIRYGSRSQSYIEGYPSVEREIPVGVEVKQSTPVTRQIIDGNVNRVRVTLTWPALQKIADNGDIEGLKVEYKIQIAYSGGDFQTVEDKHAVSGRTGDPFQRSHNVPIQGTFPAQIRVVRITDDNNNIKTQDNFSWTSYTEIIDSKLMYSGSALIAWELNAKEFSTIPARSYRIRGRKIQIPSNATVNPANGSLTYSGVWDGLFQSDVVWCADPAWCLWNLLTNTRYGLGDHIAARNLDKWSFYAASQYCNGLVPSGLYDNNNAPILEPRFLCNVNIQTQEDAYKLINDMCSVFRAMPYWGAGTLLISQDCPTDPIYVFNQTNVSEEGFQYSGSSLKTRHTVATVGYFDTSLQDIAYESVENPAAIAKFGVVTAEVTAFACTSRSQAHRLGEWLLYTEQNETEVVTFTTTIEGGISVRPGSIIDISDPLRAGVRRGGRIKAAGTDYIIIDNASATDLTLATGPTVNVVLVDGTFNYRDVASISGNRINVTQPFSALPLVGGGFIFNNDLMRRSKWRVLNVEERNESEYVVTAISYNPSKFDYIERDVPLVDWSFTPLAPTIPVDPINITASTTTVQSNGQAYNNLYVSWQDDPAALQYEVRYRLVS